MNPLHLFTLAGIPVFASPFYFLLLLMLARGDLVQGIILAIGITISLLTHEFGHALVARYLRHEPTVMLHGFGGLTSRSRVGRDVEEAAIIATGPAAGLALGLLVYALWQVCAWLGLATPFTFAVAYSLLYPCITWNLLNLLPLWPLDGGQLFRLGLVRWLGLRRAGSVTHGVSLGLLGLIAVFVLRDGANHLYTLLLLGLLAMQNVNAMRGGGGEEAVTAAPSGIALELVEDAKKAIANAQWKEAARLGHQARAQEGVSPTLLDKIWETLGIANTELGEYEEALSYLRRARPSEIVRAATQRCLEALGRDAEIVEIRGRWEQGGRGRYMAQWLWGALGFIVLALGLVFTTSLSRFFF